MPPGAVLLFIHFLLASSVYAQKLTNRTIDDTNGDSVTGAVPVYTPEAVWDGPSCNGCAILPNRAQTFDGTYHAATYNSGLRDMEISMSFTGASPCSSRSLAIKRFAGVAIYVFFILANHVADGITTTTAANFSIDGTYRGTFNHTPSTSTDFEFDALVFAQTGLENATHTLVISTQGPNDIYVNFDYAKYT
ncbi:hypothetical protein FB45DRAFT_732028 [Roridomyces roridus]|uniref:Uncharacterized protein n=1 Tax=Roridomyces roridus TaxID=1738132 RepID=A0AAD7FZ52_9AGAR|nr:hypothetical protein FB45DRAFT_732028 [Roridomyces roridus]